MYDKIKKIIAEHRKRRAKHMPMNTAMNLDERQPRTYKRKPKVTIEKDAGQS